MTGPLGGEGLGELNNTGLGGVVTRLLLRVVDDSAGHRGDVDDGTASLGLDHGLTDGLGNDEGAGDVDVDETTEHVVVIDLGLDVGAVELSMKFGDSRGF